MKLNSKQIDMFLFAVHGIGAVFVAIFSAVYLLGLPTTNVLHSEPIFRTTLSILGIILIALVLAAFVLAAIKRKT